MKQKILASFAVLALGCQIQAGGTGVTSPTPPPEPGPADPVSGPDGSGGSAGMGADPNCPNPGDHCLPEGVYFIADRDLNGAYVYVAAATPAGPVDGANEATFFNLKEGKDQVAKWHYATRAATDADLQVGRTVFMLHRQDDGIYRAPRTRQEATSTTWWMAKVASNAGLAANGVVVVTGGFEVAADAIRVADAVERPAINLDLVSGEDAHFLTPNHYIVADNDPGRGKYTYASVGGAITVPSAQTKGEGQYMSLQDGKVTWTPHAWRTRPATPADMKVGVRVFMLHRQDNKVYRGPRTRKESLGTNWWTAKVTDASQTYKGMVTVAGGFQVAIDAARVAM